MSGEQPLLWAAAAATALMAAWLLTVWINHLFEGEWLPADLPREAKLARASLEALDATWQADANRSNIVITLTTIPSRIGHIDDTIKSLLDQTRRPARIVLNVPRFSIRENCPYTIPARLRRLASLEVRECDDWGPATKLIPSLLAEDPGQPLLVLDDDRIYQPWMIARYEAASAAMPDAALTLAGIIVPEDLTDRPTTLASNVLKQPPAPVRCHRLKDPEPVDILLGVFSYLVLPRFFDLASIVDAAGEPPELRLVDDVRISAHCQAPKYAIPAPSLSFIPKRRWFFYKATALGRINKGPGGNEARHNTIGYRYFADRWLVNRARAEALATEG